MEQFGEKWIECSANSGADCEDCGEDAVVGARVGAEGAEYCWRDVGVDEFCEMLVGFGVAEAVVGKHTLNAVHLASGAFERFVEKESRSGERKGCWVVRIDEGVVTRPDHMLPLS